MARRPQKFRNGRHNMDYVLLVVVLFLVCFGLLMIYSASSYEAGVDMEDPAYYLRKQALATALGIVALFFVSKIPYKFWQRFDFIALAVSIILIFLLLTPLGVTRNGATRWIDLKIGLTLQPAEVAKIGIIIYLASMIQRIEELGKNILRTPKGLAILMTPPVVVAGLIYIISSNLSSAIIIVGIAVAMLFVAVPDYKWFIIIGVVGLAAVAAIVFYAAGPGATGEGSFRLGRVRAWLDPESYSTDKAFQTLQALYAIGSGGLWGKGLGQSMQKRKFLPEAQNDMIFSIICEELGLFGAVTIILLFVVLIWSCMIVANKTTDRFGSLLVVGVMAHYAIQVILNIAVVTNTIPNTGITLPFISYGGTSSLFLLAEIGIVLNVSKKCK
ncbi:MAG: putative peptidoglycan glycosyltransferase FtsW [Lachnospiraceae bacterium]|nr:putative peptidoglycan glycosyltransferase FtsW [Lachnospiraceae bacterium]